MTCCCFRACLNAARDELEEADVAVLIEDTRVGGSPIDLVFTGTLSADQRVAVGTLAASHTGVLGARSGELAGVDGLRLSVDTPG